MDSLTIAGTQEAVSRMKVVSDHTNLRFSVSSAVADET